MPTEAQSDAVPTVTDVGLLSPVSVRQGERASDAVFVGHLIAAELELVRAMVAVGAAPAEIGDAAAAGLRGVRSREIDLESLARTSVDGGNPLIPLLPLVRARVAAHSADAAGWVHRGATSQDIIDTAFMSLGQQVAGWVDASLQTAASALLALAQQHRDEPAAARTLTQHAVPTTLGLKAATWLNAILRSRRRLAEVSARLPAQLGGAGGTLASFVELFGAEQAKHLPAAFARGLGLQAPEAPWHTDRWPVTELGDALAAVVAAVGMFASDVSVLARTEIGEVAVAEGGGSSAMPQKQNPVDAVLIRSAAMRAPALAAQLHLAAGLAADERPDGAWHAEWAPLQELMRLALGAAARASALAGGLSFDRERARANLEITGGLIVSERLGLVLVPLIGKSHFDAIIAAAAGGEDLAALVRKLPEAADLDVDALVEPAAYTGLAGVLVDEAARRAMQDGVR